MAERISQLVEDRNDLGSNAPISTPYVVYIESSSFCNLACKFCPHFIDPEKINKTNMSPDVFLKICSDLTQFPEKIKLMRFCGLGDSLMNKSFPSFVETAPRAIRRHAAAGFRGQDLGHPAQSSHHGRAFLGIGRSHPSQPSR